MCDTLNTVFLSLESYLPTYIQNLTFQVTTSPATFSASNGSRPSAAIPRSITQR